MTVSKVENFGKMHDMAPFANLVTNTKRHLF